MDRDMNTAPHEVVNAKGNYIELDNGQSVFDATGGAAVACLGHGNEEVIAAVARQMAQVSYCHSMFFRTSSTSDLAEELIAGTDFNMAKAFIICSGQYLTPFARRFPLRTLTLLQQVLRPWKQP